MQPIYQAVENAVHGGNSICLILCFGFFVFFFIDKKCHSRRCRLLFGLFSFFSLFAGVWHMLCLLVENLLRNTYMFTMCALFGNSAKRTNRTHTVCHLSNACCCSCRRCLSHRHSSFVFGFVYTRAHIHNHFATLLIFSHSIKVYYTHSGIVNETKYKNRWLFIFNEINF